MRTTGIIRETDELGRVVIPKEIRKQLGIRDGEPLEIYLDKTADGQPMVCFAKYSITFENELVGFTTQIANDMDGCGEYELSDKFRKAIKEAIKILNEFENRG